MTLSQSKLINILLGGAAMFFFIMSMITAHQRDNAMKAVKTTNHGAASLVLVVVCAPQNADEENVARDKAQQGLSL